MNFSLRWKLPTLLINNEEELKDALAASFSLPSSWNSSDELAFIPMQTPIQSVLTVKPDDFMFYHKWHLPKTINNQLQPRQAIKNSRLHFCGFGYYMAAKQSCVWNPATISRNMGLLRAFEVVVICWEVHLRNSETGLLVSRDVW